MVRAREAILAAILDDRIPNGKLPPEDELAVMLGVSRTTVRGALQSLEQHGVLTRTPGRGTTIHDRMSPSMVALQRLIGFTQLLAEQGHKVTHEASWSTVTSQPTKAVEALGLEPGQSCFMFDRLVLAGGLPAIWAIDYFPTHVFARNPSAADRVAESPFELGRELLVESINHAIVEIVPSLPSSHVQEKLSLRRTDPYLQLHETHFGESGKPLGFSLIHVNDHFVRFQLMRRAD